MNKSQQAVAEFCKRHNMNCHREYRLLDLMSELGEFSKEILKATNYGQEPFQFREEMTMEMGDLLFSLLALANSCEIDVDQALEMAMEKYSRRLQGGTAGSEADIL